MRIGILNGDSEASSYDRENVEPEPTRICIDTTSEKMFGLWFEDFGELGGWAVGLRHRPKDIIPMVMSFDTLADARFAVEMLNQAYEMGRASK